MRSTPKRTLWSTLRQALALNSHFYETTQDTPRNRQIALTIVLLATLSRLLGSLVILLINRAAIAPLLVTLLLEAILMVSGYYFWTFVVWKMGQWLKPSDPTYWELLSPIGFAYAPQVLNFLTLIPLLGYPIELVLSVWSLLAVIVAVRQGLDIKTWQAALISILGWIPLQLAIGVAQLLAPSFYTQ